MNDQKQGRLDAELESLRQQLAQRGGHPESFEYQGKILDTAKVLDALGMIYARRSKAAEKQGGAS